VGTGGSGNHEWDQGIRRKVSGIRKIRELGGKSVGSGRSEESQWDQEKVGSGQLGNQEESE